MSLKHERKTVTAMIRLYCTAHHHGSDLCESCRELQEYADARLAACPFGDGKPTCRQCPIHCYRKEMRQRVSEVMAFAGPRMLLHHPIMALRHLLREKMRNRTSRHGTR
jgi:hypothetical protein